MVVLQWWFIFALGTCLSKSEVKFKTELRLKFRKQNTYLKKSLFYKVCSSTSVSQTKWTYSNCLARKQKVPAVWKHVVFVNIFRESQDWILFRFIQIVSSPCIHGCKRKLEDKQDKDVCAFNGLPVPAKICSSEPYSMQCGIITADLYLYLLSSFFLSLLSCLFANLLLSAVPCCNFFMLPAAFSHRLCVVLCVYICVCYQMTE